MTTVVLSAGGTGGHLFPAQALAQEMLRRGRDVVVMTDVRGRNYGSAFPGAKVESVPAASFAGRSAISRLFAPFAILSGVFVGFSKLLKLKPSAVIGFGGYPSLPVMLAAWLGGYPTAIHEQNAVLGRVNRRMAEHVRAVAASLPLVRFVPSDQSRIVYTGNPVRPEAASLSGKPYLPPSDDGPIRLLVFGGSQGARALSETVPQAVALLPEALRKRLEVVHQSRPEDLDATRTAYAQAGVQAQLASFFDDLPQRMAWAHLVISRSGASTIAELTAIGRPAILIPYPFATDDHQTANAAVMEKAGAAIVAQQRDLSAAKLARIIEDLLRSPDRLTASASAACALGKPDAAARLADLVDRLGSARAS
jgi:UDP-N-acetylglucosamine--N-acetylmuramyl-(pentapeptide) pyrophosphoryl-undecaprenol N-acetylglucosamine transferase